MLFRVGQVRWSTGVLTHPGILPADLVAAFARYIRGDWGEVGAERGLRNDVALVNGDAVFGLYRTAHGDWVCMRTDGRGTYVYLPEEHVPEENVPAHGSPLSARGRQPLSSQAPAAGTPCSGTSCTE